MKAEKEYSKGSALTSALPWLALLLLAITLAIYPTALNPGLPLLLCGLLGVLAGICRAVWGSGKYYYASPDLLLVLWGLMAVSLWWHRVDLYLGEKSLWTFYGAVVCALVPLMGVRRAPQFRTFVTGLVVLLALVSLAAWLEELPKAYVAGTLSSFKGRFANPDTFSLVPLAGFCLSMGLLERSKGASNKWLLGNLAFQLLTVFVTGCRASILGLLVGGAVFGGLIGRYRKKEIDQTRQLIVVPLLFGFLLLAFSAFNVAAVGKFVGSFSAQSIQLETIRFEVNHRGWAAASQYPVLGGGPGSFGRVYQAVRPRGHDNLYVDIAHNDYIEMAVEAGFPGLLLWLASLSLVMAKLYRCVKKGKRPFLAATVAAALASFCFYSLFNFVLPERPVLWLFCLMLGVGSAFPSTTKRYTEKGPVRFGASVVLIAGGLATCWFGIKSVRAETALAEARVYQKNLAKEQAVLCLERAIELQPNRADLYLEAADVAKSLQFFSGHELWKEKREGFLRRSVEVSPLYVRPRLGLAEYLLEEKDQEGARRQLQAALAAAPFRIDASRMLAVVYVSEQKYVEAARTVSEVVQQPGGREYQLLRGVVREMAARQPVELVSLLGDWRKDTDKNAWLPTLLSEAADKAVAVEQWQAADLLVGEALYYQADDLCLRFQKSKVTGALRGPEDELAELQRLEPEASELKGDCARGVVERYFNLLRELSGREKALNYLDEKVRLHPRSSYYRMWLAALLESEGSLAEARATLRQGLDEGIGSPEFLYQLGALYEKMGDRQLAGGYYRQVLQADSKHAGAKSGLRRVSGTPRAKPRILK